MTRAEAFLWSELEEQCHRRGLSADGMTKQELLDRIRAHDEKESWHETPRQVQCTRCGAYVDVCKPRQV